MHDKSKLFLAVFFDTYRALTESLKVLEKFRISERKVQIIAMIGERSLYFWKGRFIENK